MARLVIAIVVALLLWPLFGTLGLFGALPFLVLSGIAAVALFGKTSQPPDDDVTHVDL
jgi:hypothetical protein